ncbi:N-acetylneuraminate synthase family protein [Candidatus Pelagibacter sp.]|uniref:N-acetylneuraminate synthase family protein n=1 Tax=Candidatus Pelagibacter sp. TaxID=2024849 RepID=UPI003F84C400
MLKKNKIYFIAEAGINHNGSLSLAKKLVIAAKKAGADAIKFQSFFADEFISKKNETYKLGPQKKKINVYNLFKKTEFKKDWYKKINYFCKKINIDFISSISDKISSDYYFNLKKKIVKIASEDIINYPLLKYLAKQKNKTFIVSTGMASLEEISLAVKILKKKNKIILMHCVSLYPTKLAESNINRIDTLKKKFKLEVGYSDHTLGYEAMFIAAVQGCKVFEKHFTLSKKMNGPDHHMSMNPSELKTCINFLSNIDKIKGNGKINPFGRQLFSRENYRRSIFAKKNINKGELFSEKNICLKRPAKGLHPKYFHKIVGKKAKKSFKTNEMIIV